VQEVDIKFCRECRKGTDLQVAGLCLEIRTTKHNHDDLFDLNNGF